MSFRTTSTAMSPKRRLVRSVLPLRLDDEENPLHLSFVSENPVQRPLDHLFSWLDAAPCVESRFTDSLIDFEREIQRGTGLGDAGGSWMSPVFQIVVQCSQCRLAPH